MNLNQIHEILLDLRDAKGTKAKTAILQQHVDNRDLQQYLMLTYDFVNYTYYQSDIDPTNTERVAVAGYPSLPEIATALSTRQYTGNAAIAYLSTIYAAMSDECKDVLRCMIKRDIRAGVGAKTILKVWPNLFFVMPYQRCSLPKDNDPSKWVGKRISQIKADGMFANIMFRNGIPEWVRSRAGNAFPLEYMKFKIHTNDQVVLMGELLIRDRLVDKLLPRKVGNGILNGLAQGATLPDHYRVEYHAWDMVSVIEFDAGESGAPYEDRLSYLTGVVDGNQIEVVETKIFDNHMDCVTHYKSVLARHMEGTIVKTMDAIWKDGTSKHLIKLKVEFECELMIVGFNRGEPDSKYANSLGSLQCESADGLLATGVAGLTDKERQDIWDNQDSYMRKIVAVRANDIIEDRRTPELKSLFLPRVVEFRHDKQEADMLPEIEKILDGVING